MTAPRKSGLEVAAVIQSQTLQDLESSKALQNEGVKRGRVDRRDRVPDWATGLTPEGLRNQHASAHQEVTPQDRWLKPGSGDYGFFYGFSKKHMYNL